MRSPFALAHFQVWIGHELVSREDAKVSVFDSSVQGGDAVWEGLRIYSGGIFLLEEHLDRLVDSAKALAFASIPSKEFIKGAIAETLKANCMTDEAHIRLTLTRGKKVTSGTRAALCECALYVRACVALTQSEECHRISINTDRA